MNNQNIYEQKINNNSIMKSKKNILPLFNQLEDKIRFYLKEPNQAQSQYFQTFSEFLNSYSMNTFFHQLHNYINFEMIKYLKKGVILEDGIYILLKGQLVYVWTKNKHDRDRKEHLLNLAKNSSFSILMENPLIMDPLLEINYSIQVQDIFSVIQCEQRNYMTLEECIVLKLPQKLLEQTNFYKLKNERIDLCQKAYLPGTLNTNPCFQLNTSLHYTFKQKKAYFHNKITLNSIGIVVKGCVKVFGKKIVIAEKYAILLPFTEYEVITSEVTILMIEKNPTLTFISEELKERFRKLIKTREKSCQTEHNKTKASHVSLYEEKGNVKGSELKKRKKQIYGFSKQYQKYCILPMYSCKENLAYVKKVNGSIKQNEQKYKYPLVLFNLANSRYYKSYPSFNGSKKEEENSQAKYQGKNHESFMERYQSFSKNLYKKFVQQKNAKKERKTEKGKIKKII